MTLGLAARGGWVYWLREGGTAERCPAAGCAPGGPERVFGGLTIGDTGGQNASVAVDDTDLYVSMNGRVVRCATTGCGDAPTVMVGDGTPGDIALDADHLYWADGAAAGSVRRLAKNDPGGAPDVLASGENLPGAVRVHGGSLYWTTTWAFGGIRTCPVTGCDGEPFEVVTNLRYPSALAVDDAGLVWVEPSLVAGTAGRVARCPLAGCGAAGPETVVDAALPANDRAVSTDASRIYWAVGVTDSAHQGEVGTVAR